MSEVIEAQNLIARNNALIATAAEVEKLLRNPTFKKVILDGFCREEVVRYCGLSADPSLTATQRADALAMGQAGGLLKRWFQVQTEMGKKAAEHNAELEEFLREAMVEEDRAEAGNDEA